MRTLFWLTALALWFTYGEDYAREKIFPARVPQESYFKAGTGLYPTEVNQVSFGSTSTLFGPFVEQKEVGIWADNKPTRGRSSSWYGQYSLGIRVTNGLIYSQAASGLSYITDTDTYLGGHVQLAHDIDLGILDEAGIGIAASYKHISSAGLYTPNRGRDFFVLKVNIPW